MISNTKKDRIILVLFVIVVLTVSSIILPYDNSNLAQNAHGIQATQASVATSSQYLIDQQVNPFLNYAGEPAPMGIADYGLGYNGLPYNYSAKSFLGIINISYLSTFSPNSSVLNNMTFQLNLNLIFTYQGIGYDYWVQNVAYLNTSDNQILFLDNIWNLSGPNAVMSNSSVTGSGTVVSSASSAFYYYLAVDSLKGNNMTLAYPTTIYLKMNATQTSSGMPEVTFLYDDGFGWVVYDHAIFHFVTKSRIAPVFNVDGYSYNPFGTYYDAELIMGGPGNSSQTEVMNSSVLLSLQFFNGFNYQSVPSAYNFGSDTAETISNVVANGVYDTTSGLVSVNISKGQGATGQVYYAEQLAVLHIVTNIYHGAVYVNNINSTSFLGGQAYLTLGPGTYSIVIYNYLTKAFSNLGNVSLKSGQASTISRDLYPIEFLESGLPTGVWYLNVSTAGSGPINGSKYGLDLQNGTYNYTLYTSNKNYRPANLTGSFVVNGTALEISVSFVPILYDVSFIESGLPAGTKWSVTLNGEGTLISTNKTILFMVTNGTYGYVIPRVDSYAPPSSIGSLSVNGTGLMEQVIFSLLDGYLSGSILPRDASILVNGTLYKASNGNYNISLSPGYYSVKISAQGYLNYSTNVTVSSLNVTHLPITSLERESNYSLLIEILVLLLLFIGGIWSMIRAKRRR